jgi:hypothetical protein
MDEKMRDMNSNYEHFVSLALDANTPRCYTLHIRVIFVMEHAGTLFQKFFLRRTQGRMAFQNLSFWHWYY